jgi:hypothetical protein
LRPRAKLANSSCEHRKCGDRFDGARQPPFAGLDQFEQGRTVVRQIGFEAALEAVSGMGGIAQAKVVERDALAAQLLCEVPHGRQEQGDARLVAPDMAAFAARFDHQHAITGGVEVLQAGGIGVQLVAQDQHQFAHQLRPRRVEVPPPGWTPRRQASEQYST